MKLVITSLNPCCSGRWSRRREKCQKHLRAVIVLILVVVEDGLGASILNPREKKKFVLILVVVEDGLGVKTNSDSTMEKTSLNPCCSGRWSRRVACFARVIKKMSLNPCCSGRWSRSITTTGTEHLKEEAS